MTRTSIAIDHPCLYARAYMPVFNMHCGLPLILPQAAQNDE
jgi:hypothetical protein